MRLLNLTATAHPAGNRIDLAWNYPESPEFGSVRVVRREGTHPTTPTPATTAEGEVVAEGAGLLAAMDCNLKAETVYYYSLYPFNGNPPPFDEDPHNRVSALATGRYDFARQMNDLLPAIYHRYDLVLETEATTGCPSTEPREPAGQLRRFLDLPGSQFDQLYSLARALLHLYNLDKVDGRFLPLLAQWIGWRTDFRLEIGAQRSAIRNAPHLYQGIGLVPTIEATVKRITGLESRTKEFVNNIARTNQPERLRLLARQRDAGGAWAAVEPVSVNWAYEGRPAAVREADGSTTWFYHTYRKHGADIWTKSFAGAQWMPSEPVADQPGIDKCPSVAMAANQLWLFWQNFDDAAAGEGKWRIVFRTRTNGIWADATLLTFADAATEARTERRMPAAVADDAGGLWLFWIERSNGGAWQARYNRHDGADWELDPPATLPPDGTDDPRVEDDLIALFHPGLANQRLWLFWARHEPGGPLGQSRWTVAYRIKQGLDPNAADWSAIQNLPKAGPADYHDREPAPLLAGNDVELIWASTQAGNWAIWRNTLDTGAGNWGAAEQVTTGPYSGRAPLAAPLDTGALLVYRSNESLVFSSTVYGATEMLDMRFAGATTVDTRNTAKMGLAGQFEDFQTYTYDAGENGGRNNDDRLARDTIGLYVAAGGGDPAVTQRALSRLSGVLPEFMPATTRAVFVIE